MSEAVPRGKSQARAGSSPLMPRACSSPQRRPRGQARAAPQTLAAAPRLRCPPPVTPPPPAIGACAVSLPGRTSQLAGQTPPPPRRPPGSPGWRGTQLAGDLILAESLGATLVLESLWCRGRRDFHPGPLPWAGTGCLPVWRIEGGEQGREAEEPSPPHHPKAASYC